MRLLSVAAAMVLLSTSAMAQQPTQTTVQVDPAKPRVEIYGFAMLDMGVNFKTINPNWFDTMRVTRLPTFDGQYGEDGITFAGVRQSRLGARGFKSPSFFRAAAASKPSPASSDANASPPTPRAVLTRKSRRVSSMMSPASMIQPKRAPTFIRASQIHRG